MPATAELGARAIETARERSQQLYDAARERSRDLADNAQRYVSENPLRAVTYTSAALFGLGIIVGRLLAPDRHPADDMAAGAAMASSALASAQSRAQDLFDTAKDASQSLLSTARQRSREVMDATSEFVEDHPGRAATYAALVLLAIAGITAYAASGSGSSGSGSGSP